MLPPRPRAGQHLRMPTAPATTRNGSRAKMPAAMMFVPSIGGISHHWTENTSDEDIVLGAQVFADAIVEALRR